MNELETTSPTERIEREIIGAVLADQAIYGSIRFLDPRDFQVDRFAVIWETIKNLASQGTFVTPDSVATYSFDLDASQLANMAKQASGNLDNIRRQATTLSATRRRRQVATMIERAGAMVQENPHRFEEIASRLSIALSDCAYPSVSMSSSEATAQLAAAIERRTAFDPVPTGIAALDAKLEGGLLPASYFVGALQKKGKTTLIATMSFNLDNLEIPHLVITAEKRPTDIEAMKAARRAGTNANRLRFVPDNNMPHCRYVHCPDIEMARLRHEILYHTQPRVHGARVAFIDYWQLISGGDARENRLNMLTRTAKMINQTSIDTNIPIVTMFQLGDGPGNRETQIACDTANLTMVLHRDVNSPDAWFEMLATNLCDENNLGDPRSPAMLLDRDIGPHFRSANEPA